jgi:HEAT repeat protein
MGIGHRHRQTILILYVLLGSGCGEQLVIGNEQQADDEQQQQVTAAVAQLRDKSPTERALGAVALGNLLENRKSFESSVVRALGRAIRDPEQSVRLSAISTVAKIGKPLSECIYPLKGAMRSTDQATSVAAERAFDAIRDKNQATIEALTKKLRSVNREERARAAISLSLYGPAAKAASPELIPLLSDPYAPAVDNARQALAMIGRPAAPYILPAAKKYMESGKRSDVERGVDLLRIAGPAAQSMIPQTLTLLQQHDLQASVGVLMVVDPTGELWVPELQKMLASSDSRQRERAATWLRVLAQELSTRYVLSPPPPETANIPLPALLVTALDDENDRVRQQSALGLKSLGVRGQDVLPALVQHLAEDVVVRESCCEALRNVGPTGVVALAENVERFPDHYPSSPICSLASAAILSESRFYQAMRDKNQEEHPELPWAVATMEASAQQGVPAIMGALNSPDAKVRESAATAVERICNASYGLRRTLPPLDKNTPDDLVALRQRGEKASSALQLALAQSRPKLEVVLNDDNPAVSRRISVALEALKKMEGK